MNLSWHSYRTLPCSDLKEDISGDFFDAYKPLESVDRLDKENFASFLPYKQSSFNSKFSDHGNVGTSRTILQPKPILSLQSANLIKSSDKPVHKTSVSKLFDVSDEVLSPDLRFCSQPAIKPPKAVDVDQSFRTLLSNKPAGRIKSLHSPSKDLSEHLEALNIKNEAAIKSSQSYIYTPETSPTLKPEKILFDNNNSYKKLCNECDTDSAEFVLTSCGHKICQKCLSNLISSTPINLCTCYICHKAITSFTSRSSLDSSLSFVKLHPTSDFVSKANFSANPDIKQSIHHVSSGENSESLNTKTSTFLNEPIILDSLFSDISALVTPQDWTCLKISNIPWDLSIEAIHEFLGKNARIAPYNIHSQPIHFIMDRMSAKTQSECYVELSSRNDAQRLAERRSGKLLGSRNVILEIATQEELMNRIFPKWKGEWKGVNPYVDENLKSIRQFSVPKAEIVTREELNSLINHVKTYRSPYSRKCPQRPFEDFISILAKFPWHKGEFYTTAQRDLLHYSLITFIEILKGHLKKGRLPELNFRLLERLVHAGTINTCFTEKQKFEIFKMAGLPCNFEASRISLINLDLKAVSCLKIDHLHTTEVLSFLLYNGFKINDLQLSEKDVYSLSDIAKIEISYINKKLLEYQSSTSSATLRPAFVLSHI